MKNVGGHTSTTRGLIVGYAFALVLTAIPFFSVWTGYSSHETTLTLIAMAALVQIALHLRVFLGVRFIPSGQDSWVSLLFTAVLIVIGVGGTLWIMASLAWRMSH
jgi:cytochrome o ubiquinol oxidase subunit IV